MRKICLFFIWMVASVFSVSPQDADDWTAWVYEQNSGTVMQYNAAGELVSEIDLPVQPPSATFGFNFDVAPDASALAYVRADYRIDLETAEFFFYDLEAGQVSSAYTLKPVLDINSFNQAAASIRANNQGGAFATGYGYTDENGLPSWEVVSLPADGSEAQTLTLEDVGAAGIELEDMVSYPLLYGYIDGIVYFTVYPMETMDREFPGIAWNPATGEITLLGMVTPPFDVDRNGELLSIRFGENQPAAEAPDYSYPYSGDTAILYQPDMSDLRVVYDAEGQPLLRGFFVEGGERIGLFAGVSEQAFELRLVERDGTVAAAFPVPYTPDLYETPDGYLFLTRGANDPPVLTHVQSDGSELTMREIFTGEVTDSFDIMVTW